MGGSVIAVVGSDGQIGQALVVRLRAAAPERKIFTPAWQALHENPKREVDRLAGFGPVDWVWASGLTNPKAGSALLLEANFEGPRRAIEVARSYPGQRFLTLGTVHEHFPELCAANPYFESKRRLAEWIRGVPGALHVRLHTVYGPAPQPHMFLGQMVTALAQNRPFRMSSGEQLREYHHVEDVAGALVRLLLRSDWSEWSSHTLDLSHGRPLRLRDLAIGVFSALGRESLLELGALGAAASENREVQFQASPAWLLGDVRDPLAGVIESVRHRLAATAQV